MNNNKNYLIISIVTLFFGIFLYAFFNEIIVIHIPQKHNIISNEANTQKKIYYLYYWKENKWNLEQKEVISCKNKIENLTFLINSWLNLLSEEKNYKKVLLQNVLLDGNGTEVFISFDRSPFLKESSTHDKLMWIESLLKTISANGISLQTIRFLVNHKPLQDYHLDFTKSWPLCGFINPQ